MKKNLSRIQIYQKKQDSGFHQHRLHQMLLVENGVFLLEDDTKRQILYDQTIALIPNKTKHRTIALGDAVTFHSLYFDAKVANTLEKGIHLIPSHPLLRALIISLEGKVKQTEIRSLSLKLIAKILEELLPKNKKRVLALPIAKSERNQKIINYIELNFRKKILIEDFQNVLPLSTRQIDRTFRSELKISPLEYLKLKRIQMAVILLETTEEAITEISLSCGYESLSSFYAHFEEIIGTSPKRFRRGGISLS
ncbi:AraC family transcriptional regulator [Leptospira ryugenii]|nr:AraC family transcriptional regulator [Leptospira ryugenii]